MNDWWQGLAARERYLLIAGGVALILMLGYVLVWEPLVQQRAALRQQVEVMRADLRWMQWAAGRFPSPQAPVARGKGIQDGASLLTRIDLSLREGPLNEVEKRIEPQGEDRVALDFAEVDFAALLNWLETLARRYRLSAHNVTLERGKQPGKVRARLSLRFAA